MSPGQKEPPTRSPPERKSQHNSDLGLKSSLSSLRSFPSLGSGLEPQLTKSHFEKWKAYTTERTELLIGLTSDFQFNLETEPCLSPFGSLQGKSQKTWEPGPGHPSFLVNRLGEPQITYNYRELNMVADKLASMAANSGFGDEVLLFWEPPSPVKEMLIRDREGPPYRRLTTTTTSQHEAQEMTFNLIEMINLWPDERWAYFSSPEPEEKRGPTITEAIANQFPERIVM
ncbi:hypothetical protein RND71_010623 [Anisodus tanguticus]|uniref:Uncharacterized protein n=1 Tax=Anisodus tanguticus TaxID=243964 RepID=A0AAE1SKN8_9SOLA|nr:hypothetical protein RND71_010623 [Anisodus tanguticus]